MNTAYLCLGGNLGDREKNLADAIHLLKEQAGRITHCSPVYETEAWGTEAQPAYLNCCIAIETSLDPETLMNTLLQAERHLGRTREGFQYASRTIDIDILFYNGMVIDEPGLVIPHPRLHLRRFVLEPLQQIAPGLVHPTLHKTIAELLSSCTDTSIVTLYKHEPCTSA